MQLKKITMKNFLQHRDFVKEISGNLVGILGPNGCGKSNFLRGMRYAFIGDIPDKRKEQLLSWGADGQGYVNIEFRHNGVDGVIQRGVNGGKTFLKYGDVSVTGITATNEAVKEHLDLDKDIASTVFVEQAQLDKVLFETASVREQAFQKMCGLSDTARIHKFLGDMLSGELAVQDDPEPYLEILRRDMEDSTDRLTEAQAMESAILDDRSQLPDPAAVRDELEDCRLRISILEGIERDEFSKQNYGKELADAQAALTHTQKYAEVDLKGIDLRIESMAEQVKLIDAYYTSANDLESRKQAYAALGPCPHEQSELGAAEKELNEVRASAGAIMTNMNMYRDLRKAAEKGEDISKECCPLCGTVITDKAQLIAHVDKSIAALEADLAKLKPVTELEKVVRDITIAITNYSTKRSSLLSGIDYAEQTLARYDEIKDLALSGGRDRVSAELVKARTARERVRQAQSEHAINLHRVQKANADMSHLDSQLEAYYAKQREWTDGYNDRAKIVARITHLSGISDKLNATAAELSGVQATIKQATTHIVSVQAQIDKLLQQRERMKSVVEARKSVDNIRTWLHYSNGPRMVAGAILKDLTSHVNRLLEDLNAPFMVSPDVTTMSYNCHFSDGRAAPADGVVEASELSGGQKVMLAVAFRLASYCMFARHQGLLILDEPSAYLDDANIGNLKTLLLKVLEIATKMNLQVFISTHEKELIPCFDALAQLG